MSAITIQFLRGTTAQNDAFTGSPGELTIDTEQDQVRVHDGVTQGGNVISGTKSAIDAPTILTPTEGAEMGGLGILTASSYSGVDANTYPRATYWEIATDSGFTNLVYQSGADSSNLTSLDLSTLGLDLDYGTHYARVAYEGSGGLVSQWSGVRQFSLVQLLPDTELAKLLASDGASSDYFGISVSVSGDGNTAVIGAYGDDDLGSRSGSAYVYTRNASGVWSEQTKLLASDGASYDYFGYSVSISGDGNTAVIGAYGDDSSSGSAYVYTRNASGVWNEQTKLVASDGVSEDYFGRSVSVSGDGSTAVIGADEDEDLGSNSGSAYVFTRNASGVWSEQTKLTASDGAYSDSFGGSVSVSGDGNTAVIGAFGDDDLGTYSGSAYVYTRNASGVWIEQTKLTASDGASRNYFGRSVSVSGDGNTAVIGAYKNDDRGTYSGSAYIYTRNANGAWSEQTKLTASDGVSEDYFGRSVSVSGDGNTAVIGAYRDDSYTGSAYVYTRNAIGAWSEQTKLTASDGASYDNFGYSVSVSGDGSTAVIGAYRDDDLVSSSGSAYVFG